MNRRIFYLWSTAGTINRGRYLLIGTVLFAIKHNIDRFVASFVFDRPWGIFNYWVPSEYFTVAAIPSNQLPFYSTLLLIAAIFIWSGVTLTLRRLRDAGLPLWLVMLFFVPVVNLFLFLLLSVIPSQSAEGAATQRHGSRISRLLQRVLPDHPLGSAAMGILITVPQALAMTEFSIVALENYGWGLFVGIPFFLGLTSVLVYCYHAPRPLGRCLLVAALSILLFGVALAAFAIEGLICIAMAAPIGLTLGLFGGGIGYVIQLQPLSKSEAPRLYSVLFLAAPFLAIVEGIDAPPPSLIAVRTSIEIESSPARVWRHVVSFSELPPPEEWLFHTGIAYPVRAEINGSGVGAVRHCVFSTGAFVEPIEVWEEPQLLKFSVSAQPTAMRELSPYGNIKTPHLNDYLLSRGGQFRLVPLASGRTLLEGTTWYEVRIWPGRYWQVWSDAIIHRIHRRVLKHIKVVSERPESMFTAELHAHSHELGKGGSYDE